jgi:hypothetical protein
MAISGAIYTALIQPVMSALVAGIHVFLAAKSKSWMAGTSPAMTSRSDQKKPYEIIVMNVTFPLTFVTITVTPQSSLR